jgi:hypothetical protein
MPMRIMERSMGRKGGDVKQRKMQNAECKMKNERKTAREGWLAALVGAAVMMAALVLAGAAWSGEPAAPAEKPIARPTQGKPTVVAPPDIKYVDDEPEPPGPNAPGRPGPAATQKPEKPATNPFGAPGGGVSRKDAVPGYIQLSTDLKVPGYIYTTRAARLKVYNLDREVWEFVPVPAIKSIDTELEWARMDKEWRFKEAGNPEKVYSGREYPVRKVQYVLTLLNDHKIRGHILGQPLYVARDDKADRFLLNDRSKGAMGETLSSLKYIKHVELGPEAYNLAVEELKAKAEAEAKKAAPAGAGKAPPAPKKN